MWENLWTFKTARFTVTLACSPEECGDVYWADKETLEKLDNGTYVNVCFRVQVKLDGDVIGEDYLGNGVYEDVRDFYCEHRGTRGSYFTDMVTEAIREARAFLDKAPAVRVA